MKIAYYKSVWGMDGTLYEQLEKIAAAGYDGVECGVPEASCRKEFLSRLRGHGLSFIAQVQTVPDHYDSYKRQVEDAAALLPECIVCHSGRDTMTWREQVSLYDKVTAFEQGFPIPVAHETHRGRPTFAPWTTNALLERYPDLKICADFSHWCCVCESLLEDQQERMALPAARTIHIHARVGFAQGPQVPDPGAPEYAAELAAHEEWWKRVIKHHMRAGSGQLTVTAEYGPQRYMPSIPYEDRPVADLWEVCNWAADRFRSMCEGLEG